MNLFKVKKNKQGYLVLHAPDGTKIPNQITLSIIDSVNEKLNARMIAFSEKGQTDTQESIEEWLKQHSNGNTDAVIHACITKEEPGFALSWSMSAYIENNISIGNKLLMWIDKVIHKHDKNTF